MKAMPSKFLRRGWLALLVLLLPIAGVCQSVSSLPKPTDYVSDFAHVMSPGAIRQIDYLCGEVDHEAHAQIAVVTVKTLDGDDVADYAVHVYQKWGLGAKNGQYEKRDRGVLILVAVQDRKRFISTGYGLEGILPDALVGRIGRQMVPMLRANDFDGAMELAVGQISQIIASDAGVKLTPLGGQAGQPQQGVQIGLGGLVVIGIIILLILFVLARFGGGGLIGFLLGMFFGGGWGGGGGGGWGGGDGGGGGDGFGGFGGGSTGGGGAGGSW